MGIEIGIVDFYLRETDAMIPSWVNRSTLQVDVDDAASASRGDVDDLMGDPIIAESGAEIDGVEERHFLENAMTVYGLQHAVSNLNADTHRSNLGTPTKETIDNN